MPGEGVADVDRLYREHAAACLGLALRVVRDRQTAEDVVQDVFLALWCTGAGGYRREQGELGPWLRTVVHHRAVDAVRRAEARQRLRAAQPQDRAADDTAVHDAAESRLRVRALRTALTGLAPAQREVLGLAYFAGLTQAEIAVRLGVPLGTVKTRTRAGLLRLRDALDAVGPERGP